MPPVCKCIHTYTSGSTHLLTLTQLQRTALREAAQRDGMPLPRLLRSPRETPTTSSSFACSPWAATGTPLPPEPRLRGACAPTALCLHTSRSVCSSSNRMFPCGWYCIQVSVFTVHSSHDPCSSCTEKNSRRAASRGRLQTCSVASRRRPSAPRRAAAPHAPHALTPHALSAMLPPSGPPAVSGTTRATTWPTAASATARAATRALGRAHRRRRRCRRRRTPHAAHPPRGGQP